MSQETEVDLPPRETQESAGNKIVELDPDDTEYVESIPQSVDNPEFTHDELSAVCEQLTKIGADGQAAQLEIERRHLAENPDHILRFTTKELTGIVTSLAIAYTTNVYRQNLEANDPIERFGYLITRQEDAPLDGSRELVDLPGMTPMNDPGAEIDPFRAIKGQQRLAFTTEEGVPVQPKDDILIDYPDE